MLSQSDITAGSQWSKFQPNLSSLAAYSAVKSDAERQQLFQEYTGELQVMICVLLASMFWSMSLLLAMQCLLIAAFGSRLLVLLCLLPEVVMTFRGGCCMDNCSIALTDRLGQQVLQLLNQDCQATHGFRSLCNSSSFIYLAIHPAILSFTHASFIH